MTTVRELITILQTFDPESSVLVSSDEEGNSLHHFAEATSERVLDLDEWELDLLLSDDEEDDEETGEPVVVLWP